MINDNIRRQRIIKGLSIRELGNKLGISQTAILKIEKGEIKVDGERLLSISKALECSIADLLKPIDTNPIVNLKFRKKSSLSEIKLLQIKEIVNVKIHNYLEVLSLNEVNKPKIKKYRIASEYDAIEAAIAFRNENKLNGIMALDNLCNLIENIGICVILIDNENNKFDGFDGVSGIVNDIPFICILKNGNVYRQRFTLAHELGHLLLDMKDLDEEKMCDAFAGSLLVPTVSAILEFGYFRKHISDREYEIFQDEYKVSIFSIICCLHRDKIISDNQYKNECIRYNKYIKGKEIEKAKAFNESPNRYEMLVLKLKSQGIITTSKAVELLGRI